MRDARPEATETENVTVNLPLRQYDAYLRVRRRVVVRVTGAAAVTAAIGRGFSESLSSTGVEAAAPVMFEIAASEDFFTTKIGCTEECTIAAVVAVANSVVVATG